MRRLFLKRSILILDDSRMEREILRGNLQRDFIDFEIESAETIEEAKAIISKKDIDIFILDVNLKDESGLDFGRYIRTKEKYEFSWVIYVSGHPKYMLEAYKDVRCYEYLIKPFKYEEILTLIKKLSNKQVVDRDIKGNEFLSFEEEMLGKITIRWDSIIFVEKIDKNLKFYLDGGLEYSSKRLSLKQMLEEGKILVQSHKSFAINPKKIKEIRNLSYRLQEIIFFNSEKKALLSDTFKQNMK